MIDILLVDDHPLMGEGTKLIIENEPDMKVYFETSSLRALEIIKKKSFDVMLFDLQMPEMDGIALSKKIIEQKPNSKIVIYTGYELLPHLDFFMESGAVGFIPKTATKEQLIRAIRCALNQEIVLPFPLLKEIYHKGKNAPVKKNEDRVVLNEKERDIIRELAKGKTNKDIAQTLYIGQRSLEYTLTNLFNKLSVQTRVEAVVKAKELGLLD